MKIKIFSLDTQKGYAELENEVNNFITNINLVKILQSESAGEDSYNLTYTIIYEE